MEEKKPNLTATGFFRFLILPLLRTKNFLSDLAGLYEARKAEMRRNFE